MKHNLVLFLVTYCFSNYVKSDSPSSEEDSDESSEELFGIESKNHIESEDKMQCTDYIQIKEVESCFTAKCKTECVAVNSKIAPESCRWGCTNQISTFKAAQAAFHKTSAELLLGRVRHPTQIQIYLLLGSSVDRCWDGCIERSSKFDQTSCISGCETMRKIQNKQLRTNKQVEQKEAKPVETNELFKEKLNESRESNDDEIKDKEEIQEESGHVVRTYILWHPMDKLHAAQAYNIMFNIVQKMFQDMDDMDNMDDGKEVSGGWKDDRRQFRIPKYQPRVAALTSPGDQASDVYNKGVDSLDNLKGKIQEAVSQPEFKENVFYCLMAICCFLLLTALYDSCTEDTAAESEEEHFLLPDKATTVKLPTYEDCIKDDKYVAGDAKDVMEAKDVEDMGNMTKADLSLSFSVVLDDEDPLHM